MDIQTKQKNSVVKYWEEHLSSWEESSYYKDSQRKSTIRLWDRFSILFRGDSMYLRMQGAFNSLVAYIPNISFLDVGCVSGRFAFRLLEGGASQVVGVDVATSAIKRAEQQRTQSNYEDKSEFFLTDVVQPDNTLPQVDLITALGVIEYFDAELIATFLSNIRAPHFFFSFPKKEETPFVLSTLLRKVYLMVNRCPGSYTYTSKEFTAIAQAQGFNNIRFLSAKGFDFVTNLPIR